jgi:hypothetical protein
MPADDEFGSEGGRDDVVPCKNSMLLKSLEGRRHYPLHDAVLKGIGPNLSEDLAGQTALTED